MNSIQKIEEAVYAIRPELKDIPITLQDILLAMSKNLKKGDVLNAHLNSYYSLCFRSDDYPGLKDYNLRLSPYDQSEDTLHFIKEFVQSHLDDYGNIITKF